MILKILRYIFALWLASSVSLCSYADHPVTVNDSSATRQPIRGIQYDASIDSLRMKPLPLFAGFSVSGDLAGAVMAACSPFGQYEAAARINLKGRYFPVCEIGWGTSDHTDETTDIHYKTHAPYFRVGCDYNFARDPRAFGRILGGLRYGFSSFKYDVDGPDIVDPVWGTVTPFRLEGIKGKVHWAELSFGVEARMWSIFRLGWSFRYRVRLSNQTSEHGDPWYVPGYGRNDTHALSGTFNLIFDI